ncbi:hypothetical protein RFI_11841, partial [Reticulomyxa filosa]
LREVIQAQMTQGNNGGPQGDGLLTLQSMEWYFVYVDNEKNVWKIEISDESTQPIPNFVERLFVVPKSALSADNKEWSQLDHGRKLIQRCSSVEFPKGVMDKSALTVRIGKNRKVSASDRANYGNSSNKRKYPENGFEELTQPKKPRLDGPGSKDNYLSAVLPITPMSPLRAVTSLPCVISCMQLPTDSTQSKFVHPVPSVIPMSAVSSSTTATTAMLSSTKLSSNDYNGPCSWDDLPVFDIPDLLNDSTKRKKKGTFQYKAHAFVQNQIKSN